MNPDVIAQARAALPAWVTVAPLFVLPLAGGVLAWALARLSLRLATPKIRPPAGPAPITPQGAPFREPYADPAVHWMERARLLWGPRWLAAANLVVLPLVLGALTLMFTGPLTWGGPTALVALVALASLVGPFAVRARYENRLRHVDWAYGFWLKSLAASALLRAPHVLVALAVGLVMHDALDVRAAALVALAAPSLVALSLGAGVSLAKALGLARGASERARRLAEKLAARTGKGPRDVLETPIAAANVYTYPAVGCVLVTTPLLDVLDDEEATSMIAHGAAHLTESRARSALRGLLACVMLSPFMLARPLMHHGIATFYGALFGALVVGAVLGRALRYDFKGADEAARASEGDAGTYARALAKVYESNLVPAVLGQKNPARPHLYDRMLDAGMTPDHPRPAAPSRARAVASMLFALVVSAAAVGALHAYAIGDRPADETRQRVNVAFSGGRDHSLGDLALAAWRRGDMNTSVTLYRAVVEVHPRDVYLAANLAIVLGRAGRCTDATLALVEAQRRLTRQSMRESLGGGEREIVESAEEAVRGCELARQGLRTTW